MLYVNNVAKTLDFYHRAFNLKIKFLHDSGDYGELDTGNTTLSLSSIDLMEQLGKIQVSHIWMLLLLKSHLLQKM